MTKHYLLTAVFVLLSTTTLGARTKFDIEYQEKTTSVNAKIKSSLIAENVIQVAHPKLSTYLRVESTETENGDYQLQLFVKDLKSGNVIARPMLIAKPGELAEIEVDQQYKISLRATPN